MNLTDFSYEVLFNILLNADPEDIANYCQTSKRASGICKDQSFWREKLWRDYGKQNQMKNITWKQQYRLGPIRVINSPITAGWNYYGIIDDRGDLYMAGSNFSGQLGNSTKNFRRNLEKINLKSKVISVTAGLYNNNNNYITGVVTEDGEVYFWGTRKSILVPQKLDFPRPGKIVKFVFETNSFRQGIIMDSGLAYLVIPYPKEIILIPADTGTKIVDLVIPMSGFGGTKIICFFLDNYGNVFFFHITTGREKEIIKLDLPDPIRQLSISGEGGYFALSIRGDVYAWSDYNLKGTNSSDLVSKFSGTNTQSFYIYKVDIPVFVASISSGNGGAITVTAKGTAYVWGFNFRAALISKDDEEKLFSSGKMVRETRPGRSYKLPFIKLPLELKLKSKIKLISMGGIFTIALTEDGVINYWGAPGIAPNDTI